MPYINKAVFRLHRHVRTVLEQSGLAPGKCVVAAVSGGPDSLAMLHALHHLRDDLELSLHGAHLDHGLRGEASKADARFVAQVFRRLGVPYTLEEANVAAFRNERRLSLEEAAREVRYEFLGRVAIEQEADAIALGHTADDQAETVLMHIIRGAGLTGLRGMGAVTRRAFNGRDVDLVRPLLHVSRRETVEYCRALKLEPRQDESNLTPELARNRVRIELLPLLERYNPAIRDALARLSRSASQDVAYMEGEVTRVWHEAVRQDESGISVDRQFFSRQAPALQSHLLRRAVLSVKGDLDDIQQDHIDGMARLMAGPAGKSLDLPGGIRFSVSYADATLSPSALDPTTMPSLEGEHKLALPGETTLPGWLVTAELLDPRMSDTQTPDLSREEPRGQPATEVAGLRADVSNTMTPNFSRGASQEHAAHLDYDSIGGQLWVRSRRPGDRFQPLGMSQSKKLQDFMVDSRVARPWRDRVPLVVSPRGIAWVVGYRIAEWARVRDEKNRRLELRFRPRAEGAADR